MYIEYSYFDNSYTEYILYIDIIADLIYGSTYLIIGIK